MIAFLLTQRLHSEKSQFQLNAKLGSEALKGLVPLVRLEQTTY